MRSDNILLSYITKYNKFKKGDKTWKINTLDRDEA